MFIMNVSVVVPVYNAARYLTSCIEALESQDYPRSKYEIILVDNNSTDGSDLVANEYPSVTLLREPKPGPYAARNRGLTKAAGPIVAFTDADCAPQRDWLRELVDGLRESGVGIVLGLTLPARDSRYLTMYEAYQHHMRRYIFDSQMTELYYGYAGNMAIRRELFDHHKPFIETLRGADTIFVRQSVDCHSAGVVRYRPTMQVRHLEINSLREVCRKMFIYGRSRRSYRKIAYVRSLTFPERIAVMRDTRAAEGYSLPQSMMLYSLLAVGWAFSRMGSFCAKPL